VDEKRSLTGTLILLYVMGNIEDNYRHNYLDFLLLIILELYIQVISVQNYNITNAPKNEL